VSQVVQPVAPTDDIFAEYANVIWEAWCKKRGYELPDVANTEFLAIKDWYDRGIPLRIVLRALLDLDRLPHERWTTLRYACPIVDQTYAHWQTNMVL
jgi:hypothetical protein